MNRKSNSNFRKYIIFWLSQSVSQLGSSMTGYALVLWAFSKTKSAMSMSLMAFCNYVPYIVVSLFAGSFVDRHSKKKVMLLSDSVAAVCSLAVLLLWNLDCLQITHIYIVNAIIGFMNAFQQPASAVAVGRLVPKEEMGRVSGLNSFSSNLITVFSPIIAAAVFAFGGITIVLTIDFVTFLFAFFVLLFAIKIPEIYENKKKETVFAGCMEGFSFLFQNKGLWYIVITMAVINFLSRLTYENILSPMILFRSGNDSLAYGVVNAAIGIGGIAGGLLVSIGKLPKDRIKTMYGFAAISFLLGDLTMGLGRNFYFWSFAGIAASMPIPFIMAAQNVILYEKIPSTIQGRVFAVRNAVQFGSIPVAILLGGFLAEYVFEPFVQSEHAVAKAIQFLVGSGNGSGMAAMFLCTGIVGSLFSFAISKRKEMDELRYKAQGPKNENLTGEENGDGNKVDL